MHVPRCAVTSTRLIAALLNSGAQRKASRDVRRLGDRTGQKLYGGAGAGAAAEKEMRAIDCGNWAAGAPLQAAVIDREEEEEEDGVENRGPREPIETEKTSEGRQRSGALSWKSSSELAVSANRSGGEIRSVVGASSAKRTETRSQDDSGFVKEGSGADAVESDGLKAVQLGLEEVGISCVGEKSELVAFMESTCDVPVEKVEEKTPALLGIEAEGVLEGSKNVADCGLRRALCLDDEMSSVGCNETWIGKQITEGVSDELRVGNGQPKDGNARSESEGVNGVEDNLADDGDDVETRSEYPVPLSPLSGEVVKAIEYERAMVAEAAMKSGPAITRSAVLFEDEWLMVINKPCGIYSEHVLATVPSLLCNSTANTTRSSVQEKQDSASHLHMANRLDRDTSGVMVITKTKQAAGKLSRIFTNRRVQKSYIALCAAPPPTWKRVTVESGHGRSRWGAWRVYSKSDVGRGLPGGSSVRDMTTHLVVVAINKEIVAEMKSVGPHLGGSSWEELRAIDNVVIAGNEGANGSVRPYPNLMEGTTEGFSDQSTLVHEGDEVVVRAYPLTGRTHQIRLHCQYVGLPLRGDVKYGGPNLRNGVRYDHHTLHAETLTFKHPFTSEDLHFVAPLPQWARDAGV